MKKQTLLKTGFTPDQAAAIVRVLNCGTVEQIEAISEAVRHWRDQCYHWPPYLAESQLLAIDEIISGFGVEAIEGEYVDSYWQSSVAHYVNTGDTYSMTILYDTDQDRFIATSWGDWYERYERRHRQGN